jgi:phosphoserine phosphatase RsbU/P
MEDNLFVTVFLGQLDRKTRSFRYAGAGHEAYLLAASGDATRLVSTGLPLGIVKDMPIPCAPLIQLQAGQLLLVLSDGIVEAEGADRRQFGLERALQVVRAARERPSREIVTALYQAARAHAQQAPPLDDMTIVLVKFACD